MKFRTIRTAVTLCLTVATMVQPAGLLAIGPGCAQQQHQATSPCEDCQCCQPVQNEPSCCCGGGDGVTVDPPTEVSRSCHCAEAIPPMQRQRSGSDGQRVLELRIAWANPSENQQPGKLARSSDAAMKVLPIDCVAADQSFLCIWRI